MSADAQLEQVLQRALESFKARVAASGGVIAVAYSGGLDSAALLYLAASYANRIAGTRVIALHVHHGLVPQADSWLTHCRAQADALAVTFDARQIQLNTAGDGIEAAARAARYAALGEMCRAHGAALLLTAHHLDDQAETVLLQLLRGAGVAGLSGMDQANTSAALLGDPTLLMVRPLLAVARASLAKFVAQAGIAYVDDPSNAEPRFARNALRLNVMPTLAANFPGYQTRLARTATHAQSAQRLLIALAREDLQRCAVGATLDIPKLKELGDDRSDNLLRYWFAERGLRMPSTAWLDELRAQLFGAKSDAQLCVSHPDCHVRRHRDRVLITPRHDAAEAALAELREQITDAVREGIAAERRPGQIDFVWRGEPVLAFPDLGGSLYFEPAAQGIAADWLAGQSLQIGLRTGGERLKLAANRPTRAIKYHYQAAGVPAWERLRLPIVRAGEQVLFAAGVGMDCHHAAACGPTAVQLRWAFRQADTQ